MSVSSPLFPLPLHLPDPHRPFMLTIFLLPASRPRSYDASCLISLPGSSYFPIAALAFIPYPADPSKFNWPNAAKHFFRVRGRPVFKLTSGDEPEFVGIRTGGADSPDDPKVDVQWLQVRPAPLATLLFPSLRLPRLTVFLRYLMPSHVARQSLRRPTRSQHLLPRQHRRRAAPDARTSPYRSQLRL